MLVVRPAGGCMNGENETTSSWDDPLLADRGVPGDDRNAPFTGRRWAGVILTLIGSLIPIIITGVVLVTRR